MSPLTDQYTHTFNFPHLYSSSDPQLSAVTRDVPDFSAKYRAQAEYLRRSSEAAIVSSNDPAPQGGFVPGLYPDPAQSPTSWFGWGQDGLHDPNLSAGQSNLNMHDSTLTNDRYFLGDSRGSLPGSSGDMHNSMPSYGRLRRESVDFGSDSSSTSHSVPSSTTSSNIHLPLDISSRQQQMAYHVGMSGHQQFQQLMPSEQVVVGHGR